MITRADEVVSQIETRLADKIGSQRHNVWFKNSTRFLLFEDYLHIAAPNSHVSRWIEDHFADAIHEAAQEITGRTFHLAFTTDPELARTQPERQPDRQSEQIAAAGDAPVRAPRGGRTSLPRAEGPKRRLEDFVVGPSNRLAYAAAVSVVESPGGMYNPLFVHGGCGLGKTHLLQGICLAAAEKHPGLRYRFVSGEEFTNDFVQSIRSREQDAFRERYRDVDLLAIDDVHYFAQKKATQEEFLNTFKAIDAGAKQIVLSSDAHPKLIGHLSDHLVSRFVSGMVVRIDTPDLSVRAEFLRRRAAVMKTDVSESVINYIAENFKSNIRELEGALLKVVAQAQVLKSPITLSLAERAIKDLVRQTAPVIMLSDIENVVSIFFGLNTAELHTSRKSRTIALARGIAMYLARKHTAMSYPEIGRYMGNKNHSTVILAERRISKMLQSNEMASWQTPAGPRQLNLAVLVDDLEEQFGLKNGRVHAPPEIAVTG
ncbi:MAG: chromosomal replication initiator protein DnaA [Phycisphaerae bacterium]|nr:chromosomal replication initiator protein DnaA [Phycisphaerae bacterium]